METEWQIAIVGVGGTILGSLLTAVLQPFLEKVYSRKPRLEVSVRYCSAETPGFLKDSISDYVISLARKIRIKDEFRKNLYFIQYLKGFLVVEVVNNSEKTINSIALFLDGSSDFLFEIVKDGKDSPTELAAICEIGSLRPKSKCEIRLWTRSDISDAFWGDAKIRVTADDLGSINISKALPRYLKDTFGRKLIFSRFNFWFAVFWIVSIGIWTAAIFSGSHQ